MPRASRGPLCWLAWAALYLAFECVEHVTETAPHATGPWDPSSGIALAGLLLLGMRFLAVVVLSEVSGTVLFCRYPLSMSQIGWDIGLTLLIWGGAAWVLRRRINIRLPGHYDLFILVAVTAIAALAHGSGHILEAALGGQPLVWDRVRPMLAGIWISDMIGVSVLTPALLLFQRLPRLPSGAKMLEIALQGVVSAAVLAANFVRMASGGLQLFYLMFLPSIWVAARFGIGGAVAINLALQVGIGIAMVAVAPQPEARVAYQYRMLSLTMATLFLGAAVTQRRRAEDELRSRQEQLSRTSRLSVAGEMAAAMAHELNQPLAATVNYTKAARMLLDQPAADPVKLRAAMDGASAQAERAASIIRTLREFIGQGQLRLVACPPGDVLGQAVALALQECEAAGIRIELELDRRLPRVKVDAVQIQQVMTNLIRNAVDAMETAGIGHGQVSVSAVQRRTAEVEVTVADNGPGMEDDVAARLYLPFISTKRDGMGLGLSISRTIIEAHGGRLWLAGNGPGGCVFRFTLPVAAEDAVEEGV